MLKLKVFFIKSSNALPAPSILRIIKSNAPNNLIKDSDCKNCTKPNNPKNFRRVPPLPSKSFPNLSKYPPIFFSIPNKPSINFCSFASSFFLIDCCCDCVGCPSLIAMTLFNISFNTVESSSVCLLSFFTSSSVWSIPFFSVYDWSSLCNLLALSISPRFCFMEEPRDGSLLPRSIRAFVFCNSPITPCNKVSVDIIFSSYLNMRLHQRNP